MSVLAVETADEAPMPARTVMDGRVTLGFLWHNDDGTFSATDADGVPLATFLSSNRRAAGSSSTLVEARMAEPTKKPMMQVRVGGEDLLVARELTVKGRDAWPLKKLIDNGERGITALDEIGPRLSHYIFKLRRAGFAIETKDERHGGAFAGTHGRYVLISPVSVVEGSAT